MTRSFDKPPSLTMTTDNTLGKILATSTILLFLTASVSAQSISVTPNSFSTQLAAGSDTAQNIDVTYSGDTSVVAELNKSVQAQSTNTNGINVSLSDQQFILNPGETRTVQLKVETSHALVPDNFTAQVNAATQIETATSESPDSGEDTDDGGGDSIDIGDTPDQGNGEQGGTGSDSGGGSEQGSSEQVNQLKERVSELQEQVRSLRSNDTEPVADPFLAGQNLASSPETPDREEPGDTGIVSAFVSPVFDVVQGLPFFSTVF